MKGNQVNGLFYANSNITKTIRRWLYPIINIAAHIISNVWQYIIINLTHWTFNAMCAVYVRCGLRVNRCALWQPPRYAGSWPSCPSCSSRRQAWDSRWPGTQTMPRRLTRRSGRWESWWILGELGEGGGGEREREGVEKRWKRKHENWYPSTRRTSKTDWASSDNPPLTTPHFTVSDWTGWLWWQCLLPGYHLEDTLKDFLWVINKRCGRASVKHLSPSAASSRAGYPHTAGRGAGCDDTCFTGRGVGCKFTAYNLFKCTNTRGVICTRRGWRCLRMQPIYQH